MACHAIEAGSIPAGTAMPTNNEVGPRPVGGYFG